MLPPAAVCIYKTVHFLFISYVNNWQIVGHCVLLYNTNFRSISSKTIIVFFHVTSLWTATWDAVQLVWKLSVLPSFTQCKHCCEMCEVNSCVCVCVCLTWWWCACRGPAEYSPEHWGSAEGAGPDGQTPGPPCYHHHQQETQTDRKSSTQWIKRYVHSRDTCSHNSYKCHPNINAMLEESVKRGFRSIQERFI